MEKDDFEKYLKQLEELDDRINNEDDFDPAFLTELNNILNGLSQDVKSPTPTLKIVNKSNNPDPVFAHEGDSGFDLRANLTEDIIVEVGKVAIIPTGLYFEINKGFEIQIRSRSGMAAKENLWVLNSPGTIDSHYRGEIKIILANFGPLNIIIKNGDRIAQGVVCPVYGEGKLKIEKVENLSETARNEGGFGSTGKT